MHIHQNYRLGWCPWMLPIPFACNYIQLKDNDKLLLGSNNGVVVYVNDFTNYVMESILELRPLFYQMISTNVDMQLLNKGLHWVDIDVLDDVVLVSISNIGVHWVKLEGTLHSSINIEFFGGFDILDNITTTRRLRNTWIFAIATLKGFIYFFDVKAGVLITSVFHNSCFPLLHRLGNIITPDLRVPDAFVCSASVYPSTRKGLPIMQDIWICCIGSIGGNLTLCDLHKQTIVSKLHVMEGPILSLAITNNCVVVVGVTHKINDDEQELIFALHGEISFARHVQLLAQRHHWRIDITILDGKRLRSILHLKNAIWEPAVVSFPITKTMPQNVLPKKKRCVGFATKSSTTLPNFLLESCMNNNLFFYKNLYDYNFQLSSLQIRLPDSSLSFDFCYKKNADFGLLVCFDYTGTIFYNPIKHFLSKCYHIKNYFPLFDSRRLCNTSTQNDNVPLNLAANDSNEKINMGDFQLQNENDSTKNGFFQQETSICSAFLPHICSYQNEYRKACLVAVQRIFLSKVPFNYRYLPWNVALFTVQQYTSGNVGYFGKWLSGAYRKTMSVNLLLESLLNHEMDNLGYSMVDFQNRATSLIFDYPENTQLQNRLAFKQKLESLHANSWQCYFSPSHRRSFLYNTDTILACFNRVGPSGLEPSSRCRMVNIFIQIFCYLPTFMSYSQKHFCTRENCLLCELGFTCHMLRQATLEGKGKPCQAKNFITTLGCIPEVALLGFVPKKSDTPSSLNFPSINQSLLKSVEIFIYFLFQELSRDIQRAETTSVYQKQGNLEYEGDFISKLFGWKIRRISSCYDHTLLNNLEPMTRFVVKLLNEEDTTHTETMGKKNNIFSSLETIFKKALNKSCYGSSFCTQCRKHTLQCHKEQVCHSTKRIISTVYQICSIPPVIVVDCGSLKWEECSTTSIPEYLWLSNPQTMGDIDVTTTRPTNQLTEQYTCYILQSVVCQIEEEMFPQTSLNMFGEPLEGFLMQNDAFINNYENKLSSGIKKNGIHSANTISDFGDFSESIFQHLTGYIRIPISYLSQRLETTYSTLNYSGSTRTSDESTITKNKKSAKESRRRSGQNDTRDAFSLHSRTSWVHFNDLLVTKVTKDEVLKCSTPYKVVACLVYVQEKLYIQSLQSNVTSSLIKEHLEIHSQLPVTVIETNENLSVHPRASSIPHFLPFTKNEISIIQKKGSSFSIDAEFVLLNKPQDLRDDRYALARISILRAEGDHKGIPCLDSHVVTNEEPLDYLTRFSGLKPGDLNTTHSSHWLTSHKSVYQKLRFLIQHNCRFIGHGIAKDFRILNIFVPSTQTVDTAQLFRLPGHRFFSLRFLTKHLFERDVQTSGLGHDSVADAIAANDLFNHYELLDAQGILPHTLDFLYSIHHYTGYNN